MSPRQVLLAAISAGAFALSIGQASAALISPDLVIEDGDKRFSGFTCNVVGAGTFSGGCGTLDVQPLAGDEIGLRFQNGWVVVDAGSTLDMLIGYHVEVLDPAKQIESITLDFNGATSGGVAIASVTETATENGAFRGQAVVNEPPAGPVSVEVLLNQPASELDIMKDILLTSFEDGARATISFIDQDFHQTGNDIPEPATLALFGAGLVGLGLLRRRRAM